MNLRRNAEHNRALGAHNAAWEHMHRIGLTHGRDSEEYRVAREATIAAARQVRAAARAAKSR